jgi:glutathione S-transferase
VDSLLLIIGNKNYSSWSLRPWLTLKHTGAPFTETLVTLYHTGFKQEILRYSGAGKVPVLKHGKLTVWDSLAICEYLAELFPAAKLWPEVPAARAEARSISAEMHSGFGTLRSLMPMNCRARGRRVTHTMELDGEIARVQEIWNGCRAHHKDGGPYLFGCFSIADAMYAPVVMRFLTYGVETKGAAKDYVAAIEAHPHVQEWLAASRAEQEVIPSSEVGK